MAITINGYSLSPHMLWTDRHKHTSVIQSNLRTLGGRLKVFSHGVEKGRPITLEAIQDQGWLTLDQVTYVEELASTPGATYSLEVGGDSFTVMFRYSDGLPVEFTPLISRIEEESADFYTGVIRLMTV